MSLRKSHATPVARKPSASQTILDGSSAINGTHTHGAFLPDDVVGQQRFVFVDAAGHDVEQRFDSGQKVTGQIIGESANSWK
jgi:hypothetical protein